MLTGIVNGNKSFLAKKDFKDHNFNFKQFLQFYDRLSIPSIVMLQTKRNSFSLSEFIKSIGYGYLMVQQVQNLKSFFDHINILQRLKTFLYSEPKITKKLINIIFQCIV
ncbi:hypothetical protein pb186bvf_017995 [Paramecium bursaria]